MIFGIVLAVLILALFIVISLFASLFFPDPLLGNYISGGIRLITGIAAAAIFAGLYSRQRLKESFSFKGFGRGLLSSLPLLLFSGVCIAVLFIGLRLFYIESVPEFIGNVVVLTLTTSIFEELVFRGLLMGGYFLLKHQNRLTRLIFAILSAGIFTACHPQYYASPLQLFRLFALGFSLAAVFLFSRNLLICTLMHFIYNVSVNLLPYGFNVRNELRTYLYISFDYIYILIFAFGLLFILLKKPYKTDLPQEEAPPEDELTDIIAEAVTE